jgi:four helix bundle protein
MEKFRFLKWSVYKESQDLFTLIIRVIDKIPREYRFELGNQIIRSSFSVVLNIAEGSGKNSDRELNRFFEIALGSLYETLAGIDTLRHNGFITYNEFDGIFDRIDNISKQIGGFKKKLSRSH